jgi:hypothetical protein
MALYVELGPGDELKIGGNTVVGVEKKSGGRTRLRVESEYRVNVVRKADTDTRPTRPAPNTSESSAPPNLARPRPLDD